ncbi:class I SAM-dependent methyltransferase [Desulfobacca acetoxidans]|uniref:class I SAM-dependent methyltransferase n=1 Tax=Desulfobacca acetoxidans TaxID=60893 RepID=UPI000A066879
MAPQHLAGKNIPATKFLDLSKKYDIVCLFQVLEHLVNPKKLIDDISQVLNPDARLLISVLNAEEYNKIGHSWVGFRVDLEHLNYFNLRNLSEILLSQDMYIEHFWEHKQPSVARNGDPKINISLFRKLYKKIFISLLRYFCGDNLYNQGSFVLTVLARKA